jgi:hypothetical protein
MSKRGGVMCYEMCSMLTPFARAPHPYRSIKDIRDNKT